MRGIVKTILIIGLIFIIFLSISFTDLGTDLINSLNNRLVEREIQNGIISGSYLTIAVTIMGMSSIIFSISLGMMQNLSNELSYQTYEEMVLKNNVSKRIFLSIIFISVILIGMHLFINFTLNPIKYVIILIVSIILVTRQIIYLVNNFINNFSLYSITERQYEDIIEMFNNIYKKAASVCEKYKKIQNKISCKNKYSSLLLKKDLALLAKRKDKLIASSVKYNNVLCNVMKEYFFMASNAYKKGDVNLYRHILSLVTKIGVHRFEKFGTMPKEPNYLSLLGELEKYDEFVELYIIPFYTNMITDYSSAEFIKCSNEEISKLLLEGERLKYSNDKDYNKTFYISLELYKNSILAQIRGGYQEAVLDFTNAIVRIIKKFEYENSKILYIRLADYVLELAQPTLENLSSAYYINLTKVLNELRDNALYNKDTLLLEQLLEKQIELLEINLLNINKVEDPFSLHILNSHWLDSLNQEALQARLRNLYNSQYSGYIENPEYSGNMYRILQTVINVIEGKSRTLLLASSYDHMFLYSFTNLIYEVIGIIRKYIGFNNKEFICLYQ